MGDVTKQMGIFAAAVVIIVGFLVVGGQGCDARQAASKREYREKVAECITAGRAPLECREVIQ